jgi:hypothetical protein
MTFEEDKEFLANFINDAQIKVLFWLSMKSGMLWKRNLAVRYIETKLKTDRCL